MSPPKRDIVFKYGNSELYNAVMTDRLDEVKYLIESGADVNRKLSLYSPVSKTKTNDVTVLMAARSESVAKLLISSGADPNAVNSDSNSVLVCAIQKSNLAIVELLLACKVVFQTETIRLKTISESNRISLHYNELARDTGEATFRNKALVAEKIRCLIINYSENQ